MWEPPLPGPRDSTVASQQGGSSASPLKWDAPFSFVSMCPHFHIKLPFLKWWVKKCSICSHNWTNMSVNRLFRLSGLLSPCCLNATDFSALQQIMLSDPHMIVLTCKITCFSHTHTPFALNGPAFSSSLSPLPLLSGSSFLMRMEMSWRCCFRPVWKWSRSKKRKLCDFLLCWAFSRQVHFWDPC